MRIPLAKRLKIGLALGGGAARALSHIGVLETLVANRIPIDFITGTSMGAIIGAMYAIDPDMDRVREKWPTSPAMSFAKGASTSSETRISPKGRDSITAFPG